MALTYQTRLSITPGNYPVVITLNQYDSDFTLIFDLYTSSGTLTIETGTTAAVRGTKPDGNGYSASATISNNSVTVTGDAQMTAIAGDSIFEIVLSKDGAELSSANFILHVERAALDKDTITSQSVIRELIAVIDRTDEIIAASHTVEEAVDELNELLPDLRTAAEAAINAAQTAAADLRNEMQDDIEVVVDAKEYIENYIEGLVYGDEVSY